MDLLDLTLPTLAENLALDEALLDELEVAAEPRPLLRIWEPTETAVVVGRASVLEEEVRQDACAGAGVAVMRRASGGAAIVTGPGCLMYAALLHTAHNGGITAIDQAHRLVLETILAGLRPLVPGVSREGLSDLALDGKKFSGNSLRVKRRSVLYHGTLLYDFPLEKIGGLLATAPRQPDYRHGRDHDAFVTNLPLSAADLRQALVAAWNAGTVRRDWPREAVARLVAEKYARPEWNSAR